MGFFRRKSGIMVLLLCLALLAAAAWYCLGGEGWRKPPEGTLVFHKTEWIPLPLPQKLPVAVPCAMEDPVFPCMEVSA